MSAGFDHDAEGEITKGCVVVSIYEDLGSRDLLLRLCDSLAWKFRDELEFQFGWWRFKYLADPEIAMEAAERAVQADLILLAAHSLELPTAVKNWFEDWLPNREAVDGALVLVQPAPKAGSSPLGSYLRSTASRAHLDYLPLKSAESAVGAGAGYAFIPPAVKELLASDGRPTDWGINE